MKLYMVRHGQSLTNLEKRYTGWAQVPLTDQGRADAEQAGQVLRHLTFDQIYSSDLIRAVNTAKIALPGCEPIQTPLLREIGLGILEEQSIDKAIAQYGEPFARHRAQRDYTAYGGENHAMLRNRVETFFKLLEQQPCENVAAFAHAGTLRAAMDVVLHASLENQYLQCPNCCIAVFVYDNIRWSLQSWGPAQR